MGEVVDVIDPMGKAFLLFVGGRIPASSSDLQTACIRNKCVLALALYKALSLSIRKSIHSWDSPITRLHCLSL